MSADYSHVQIALRNAHFYGATRSSMAKDCGLSPTTIKKFAMGATQRPSFETVLQLAELAGYKVEVARSSYVSNVTALPVRTAQKKATKQ